VVEEGSGVEWTRYRVFAEGTADHGAWKDYGIAFTLEAEGVTGDGRYLIEFRSQDNAQNREVDLTKLVVLDDTAPVTTIDTGDPKYAYSGPEDAEWFVRTDTPFTVIAADVIPGSGIATVQYQVDGTGEAGWSSTAGGTAAFDLNGRSDGPHTIYYRGIDTVDNVEEIGSLAVVVDDTAPAVDAGSDRAEFAELDGSCGIILDGSVDDGPDYDQDPQITWTIDGVPAGDQEDLSHTFSLFDSPYTPLLTAVDHLENTADDDVSVTVMQRLVDLEYTGDTSVDWSDEALLRVRVDDVTFDAPGADPLESWEDATITFTILMGGVEQFSYTVYGTDENGEAAVTHSFAQSYMPAGPYKVLVEFSDAYNGSGVFAYYQETFDFTVDPEYGILEYSGEQVVTIYDEDVTLRATLYQGEDAGDTGDTSLISFDDFEVYVIFKFYGFNSELGSDPPLFTSQPVRVVDSPIHGGVGYGEVVVDLPAGAVGGSEDAYVVLAELTDAQYIWGAKDEKGFTVYDPDGTFFTGGGYVIDSQTGRHNNFSVSFRFNKKGKAQGKVMYILRDEVNGLKYRLKSNQLDSAGFPMGDPPGTPTGVADGKCNLAIYDLDTDLWLGGEGNLDFYLTVEDLGSSGIDQDTFQLEVRFSDGVPYPMGHMEEKQLLKGGNIVIHDPSGQ
jgi:hypothetical protein